MESNKGANRRDERGEILLDPYYVTTAPNISTEEVQNPDENRRKMIATPNPLTNYQLTTTVYWNTKSPVNQAVNTNSA